MASQSDKSAYQKQWTERNKERLNRERREKYKNSESLRKKILDRVVNWRKNNPEKLRATKRKSYNKNKVLIGRQAGESHHRWKGDFVGYHALHVWVSKQLGKPSKCEHCLSESPQKRFEWSNVDHKYARVLSDYTRLCTSCHRIYDYKNGLSKKGGRPRKS